MSAPSIWIIFPLFISIILLFIRKNYRLACLIQFGVCILMVILLLMSRIGEVVTQKLISFDVSSIFSFLGRSLILEESDKFIIGLFYVILAFWSLVLFVYNQRSKVIPLGLTFISLLLAAIAVEPFLYSALIIEIAVIISIVIVVDLKTFETKGVIRFLIFFTLGMPFVLLAGWYLSGGEVSPVNEEQLIQATLLLGLGFIFWLAVFPFHSWIPLIAEESQTADGIYILTVLPFAIFIILLKYLNGFVWLRESDLVFQALLLFGVIMVCAGSIWSLFQTRVKKLVGYLTITLTGFILISIGLNSSQGFQIFSNLLLPRFIGYFLLLLSLVTLEKDNSYLRIADLKSGFFTYPFASAGLLLSFFSMVGMPLTAGFTPLQALYQATSKNHLNITILLLASNILLTIAFMRILMILIQPIKEETGTAENLNEKLLIGFIMLFSLLIGLIPNLFYPGFNQMLNSFEFLVK